jgi:hypothetical protein
MTSRRVEGADFGVTVDGACPIRCEVLGNQIEFWFGDVASGLIVYFDRPGYANFVRVQAAMVERVHAASDGARVEIVVGDNDPDIHGSRAGGWVRPQ